MFEFETKLNKINIPWVSLGWRMTGNEGCKINKGEIFSLAKYNRIRRILSRVENSLLNYHQMKKLVF